MDLLTTCTHHTELQVSTLYKSLAHAKSSLFSLDVSWQRLLTVQILQLPALNYTVISSQPPLQSSNDSIAPSVFFITPRHGPHRKLRSCIVACVFVFAGTCLPSRCSQTAVCLFPYCISTSILVFA
jgi:hypothetical protein